MRMPWWLAAVCAAVTAAIIPSRPLDALAYALLIVWGASWWITRHGAVHLVVTQTVRPTHVAMGEPVALELRAVNPGILPVPWLALHERVPVHLFSGGGLHVTTGVAARGTANASFALRPAHRGRYRLGRVAYTCGDWFGLHREARVVDFDRWITVYPTIVRLPPLRPDARSPAGPRRDPVSPFRDELAGGVRPYVAGDPLRHIAWRSSARHGRLEVKDLPRVRERTLMLVLDLHRPSWQGSLATRCLERAVSVAASMAWRPPAGTPAVGLCTFAASVRYVPEGVGEERQPPEMLWLSPRLGAAHRRSLLESLAGVHPAEGAVDLAALLLICRLRLPPGAAVVALCARYEQRAWGAAAALSAAGHPVWLLCFEGPGTGPKMHAPGLHVRDVSMDGDVRWE